MTHSEIVEEAGIHEVASNIATTADGGGTVRTFDFEVGVVELGQDGTEIASSSADPPAASDDSDTTDQQPDNGRVNLPVVLFGVVAVVVVTAGALYWRRRSD